MEPDFWNFLPEPRAQEMRDACARAEELYKDIDQHELEES